VGSGVPRFGMKQKGREIPVLEKVRRKSGYCAVNIHCLFDLQIIPFQTIMNLQNLNSSIFPNPITSFLAQNFRYIINMADFETCLELLIFGGLLG
jgi:hypothetical protein